MYEKIREQYDSLYTVQHNVFGEGKSEAVVERLGNYLAGGMVLDVGGGEGRNALYLAERGFAVSVMDISAVGVARLDAAAKEQGLNISTRVCDVATEPFERSYDAIIITFVLHHINEADAQALIQKAQRHTTTGGVHVISTFSNRGDLANRNATSGRFYPSLDTLREWYAGWDIKELSEYETMTHARYKNGERMENHVLSLVAVKAE